MIDVLGVVENPKMAETIAISLSKGNFTQDNTVSKVNPFYSFSSYYQNKLRKFKLVSTNDQIFSGKLERIRGDFASSLKNCFEYTIPINDTYLISHIKKMASQARTIIVFANCSLNGDVYAYHLSTLFGKTVMRPLFSSLSELNLEESIINVKELKYNYAISCSFEIESTYRFSNIITNFLNTYLVINLKTKSTLAILNPLNLDILSTIYNTNFENSTYSLDSHTIEVKLLKNDIIYSPRWLRGNLFCKLTAYSLYSNIFNGDPQAQVISKEFSTIEKARPLPLNYAKLVSHAIKYLKLSVVDINKYLIELYNEGYVSYPFTDSTKYSDDFDFLGTVMNLSTYEPVSTFVSSLKKKIVLPRTDESNEIENVNANLPIFPSQVYHENEESPKGLLFLLIVRHFLASISEDAIINVCTINFQISNECFQLKYQQIDKNNIDYCWLTIFPYKNISEEEVPDFTENEILTPKSIKLVLVKNTYSDINETKLLKILQSKGIKGKEIIDGLYNLITSTLVKKTAKGLKTSDFASALVISFEKIGFDFRNPYFLNSIKEASSQIRKGNNSEAQYHLLSKFLAMIQVIKSKTQAFNAIIDLILKKLND